MIFKELEDAAQSFIDLGFIGMAEKTTPLNVLCEEDALMDFCHIKNNNLKTTLKNTELYDIFFSAWMDPVSRATGLPSSPSAPMDQPVKYHHNITLSIVHKTYADKRDERWKSLLSPAMV